MKKAVIITEAHAALGLGHVQRMLSLAEHLRGRADVAFVTASEVVVRDRIAARGFPVVHAARGYEPALEALGSPDAVLVDKLHVEESLAEWVRARTNARLAIFGNLSEANRHAHAVVNAILGTRFKNRRREDPATGTVYLEGPRYAILASEFLARRNRYEHRGRLRRVLLLFGGADPANLSCRAARRLLESESEYALTVCAGPLYAHGAELESLAAAVAGRGRTCEVIRNSPAVWDLMLGSDFILTSPGSSLFEAFCLGVPALAFFQNESQAGMFRGFPMTHEQDAVEDAGTLMRRGYDEYDRYRAVTRGLDVGGGLDEIRAAVWGG